MVSFAVARKFQLKVSTYNGGLTIAYLDLEGRVTKGLVKKHPVLVVVDWDSTSETAVQNPTWRQRKQQNELPSTTEDCAFVFGFSQPSIRNWR